MKVAVRISDLRDLMNAEGGSAVRILLQDFITKDAVVVVPEKYAIDGYAVVFNGPAAKDPAKLDACLGLLKTAFREKFGREIRIYTKAKGKWKRLQ